LRIDRFALTAVRRLFLALLFVVVPAGLAFGADAGTTTITPGQRPSNESRIVFWNRTIAVQRGSLAGITPQERAERAAERLYDLPLSTKASDIVVRAIKVENQDGVGFVGRGQVLFFMGTNDLDKESGETLEQAEQAALRNLSEALEARVQERSWPVIRSAIVFTLVGLVLLVAFCALI